MSTKSWRKSLTVIERLLKSPQSFSLFQALRLIEIFATKESKKLTQKRISQKKLSQAKIIPSTLGRYTPPNAEPVRLNSQLKLIFSESDVADITRLSPNKHSSITQWQVLSNVMGLNGAQGVMPHHYSEFVLERIKHKDYSMESFFNLFNHRTQSLYYRAAYKYRLPLNYEKAQAHHYELDYQRAKGTQQHDKHTNAILSLIGLGSPTLQNRQIVKDETLLYYSGLLSQNTKTTSGLKNIIQDYFDIPANIEQFVGEWQPLIDDVRTKLGGLSNRKGQNACLGKSALLGKKGWFAQGRIKVKIGPLNKKQFEQFAPDKDALKSLDELAKSYLGLETQYDFEIQVKEKDIPHRIKLGGATPSVIGWNSWMSSSEKMNTHATANIPANNSTKNSVYNIDNIMCIKVSP